MSYAADTPISEIASKLGLSVRELQMKLLREFRVAAGPQTVLKADIVSKLLGDIEPQARVETPLQTRTAAPRPAPPAALAVTRPKPVDARATSSQRSSDPRPECLAILSQLSDIERDSNAFDDALAKCQLRAQAAQKAFTEGKHQADKLLQNCTTEAEAELDKLRQECVTEAARLKSALAEESRRVQSAAQESVARVSADLTRAASLGKIGFGHSASAVATYRHSLPRCDASNPDAVLQIVGKLNELIAEIGTSMEPTRRTRDQVRKVALWGGSIGLLILLGWGSRLWQAALLGSALVTGAVAAIIATESRVGMIATRLHGIEGYLKQLSADFATSFQTRASQTEKELAARNNVLDQKKLAERDSRIKTAKRVHQQEMERLDTKSAEELKQAEAERERSHKELSSKIKSKLDLVRARNDDLCKHPLALAWSSAAWQTWPDKDRPASTPAVRLGTYTPPLTNTLKWMKDQERVNVPAFVQIACGGKSLLIKSNSRLPRGISGVQSMVFRLLTSIKPGNVQFTFIDPVGLGEGAACFMKLTEFDDKIVGHRAWSEPRDIERELETLTSHIADIIQGSLRNTFPDIDAYNAQAAVPQAYRFVVVFDFPVGFTEGAAKRLTTIVENGARCGVFAIIVGDGSKKCPYGFEWAELQRKALVIDADGDVWSDATVSKQGFTFDSPPSPELTHRLSEHIGTKSKSSRNVSVPLPKVLETDGLADRQHWWDARTDEGIEVPLGPRGSGMNQQLILGRDDSENHYLVLGKTGSGKTNLLHVMILGLAIKYRPEELELYLVDFKSGVEFKTYASRRLPHARVVAIESEREFGLSVLRALVGQMHNRADLFRAAEQQKLSLYRKLMMAKARQADVVEKPLPRIVLIVDEYQELFKVEDSLAGEARMLLETLVRQGRSYGIHVILGSQSLAGSSSLPTEILSQIGGRIVLQVESIQHAEPALGVGFPASALPKKVGEAVFKVAGKVGDDTRFQVAEVQNDYRDQALDWMRAEADRSSGRKTKTPLVFEGDEPAELGQCAAFSAAQVTRAKFVSAWLGEPIEMAETVSATFRRQSASHLAVMAHDEEQGLGVTLAVLLSIAAQRDPDDVSFTIIDFSSEDEPWSGLVEHTLGRLPNAVRLDRSTLDSRLAGMASELELEGHHGDHYLVLLSPQRSSALTDNSGGFGFSGSTPAAAESIAKLLRRGPDAGYHVIATVDSLTSMKRVFRQEIVDFGLRVAGSAGEDDLRSFFDERIGQSKGRKHRMVFKDMSKGDSIRKFRPFRLPTPELVERTLARAEELKV